MVPSARLDSSRNHTLSRAFFRGAQQHSVVPHCRTPGSTAHAKAAVKVTAKVAPCSAGVGTGSGDKPGDGAGSGSLFSYACGIQSEFGTSTVALFNSRSGFLAISTIGHQSGVSQQRAVQWCLYSNLLSCSVKTDNFLTRRSFILSLFRTYRQVSCACTF